jgi:hypothetical protein
MQDYLNPKLSPNIPFAPAEPKKCAAPPGINTTINDLPPPPGLVAKSRSGSNNVWSKTYAAKLLPLPTTGGMLLISDAMIIYGFNLYSCAICCAGKLAHGFNLGTGATLDPIRKPEVTCSNTL